MRTTLAVSILAISMALMTSCDEKAKLADSVSGAWSGSAERVETPNLPTTTTVTRMYTFTPSTTSKTGGTLTATAMFSVESGTQLQASGIQPIAVTANGTATITGHWEAIDDDELMVSFDSNTLQVNVDPQEVVLQYDIATQTSEPVTENIAPDIALTIQKSMTTILQHSVFNFSKIDDIKVKGSLMSCEINKKDYTLHRDM